MIPENMCSEIDLAIMLKIFITNTNYDIFTFCQFEKKREKTWYHWGDIFKMIRI